MEPSNGLRAQVQEIRELTGGGAALLEWQRELCRDAEEEACIPEVTLILEELLNRVRTGQHRSWDSDQARIFFFPHTQ